MACSEQHAARHLHVKTSKGQGSGWDAATEQAAVPHKGLQTSGLLSDWLPEFARKLKPSQKRNVASA